MIIFRKLAKFYWTNKIALMTFIAPLTLMFLPIFVPGPESQCAFVLALFAVLLITEVLPMAITGLLPMLFIPLFGIVQSSRLAACYMEDFMILFLCSMSIATLMEKTNFHRRIALNVMLLVGEDTGRLLFGFTFVTWFFSMWMSNTATTAMVLPIAEAIIEQKSKESLLKRHRARSALKNHFGNLHGHTELEGLGNGHGHDHHIELEEIRGHDEVKQQSAEHPAQELVITNINHGITDALAEIEKTLKQEVIAIKNIQKMLVLAVAFTASIGGTVTITGTSTNLILIGVLETYPGQPLNFSTWIMFALPVSCVIWLTCWLWMLLYFCGWSAVKSTFTCKCKKSSEAKSYSRIFLENEIAGLGKFSFEEGCTLFYFVVLVFLWMSRDIGDIGWSNFFKEGYVSETQAGVAVVVLCCMTPALSKVQINEVSPSRKDEDGSRPSTPLEIEHQHEDKFHAKFLICWSDITKTVPWDLYFLIGGGIAISLASQESGLSDWIGEQLSVLGTLPPELILTIICYFSAALTQIMSNTAVCSILMPILLSMTMSIGINPLYIMFPAAISCSLAFLLPIATPPNTLAYSTGLVTTLDMIKAGSMINLLAVAILVVFVITYGQLFIPYDVIPQAFLRNVTVTTIAPHG